MPASSSLLIRASVAGSLPTETYSITLRAPDRTLTDEEINGTMEKVLKALKEFGAELRG